jgi:hypothetical protein
MHPGDDDETAHGTHDSDETRQTADLSAAPADATTSTHKIRPAVTEDTAASLPTIAASPRRIPQSEPRPSGPRWRLPAVALAALVALLVAGALIGRLTAPRTPQTTPTNPNTIVATVPPVAPPPPASATTVPPVPARPSDALAPWAAKVEAAVNVPATAVQAYGYAQLVLEGARPECHLGWTTLAGIGEVATQHGQVGGAVLDQGGRTTPPILGPVLDGRAGRPLIADTDAGAFDADPNYDRAMGPMLLMPAIWRAYASDGDDDQIQDPYDIDDATLAVARLLCSGTEDLNQLAGWTAALARLQPGAEYARAVFLAADGYGQQSRDIG